MSLAPPDGDTRDRLIRIEQRIAHIEQMMSNFEQAAAGFLAGPGKALGKMFGAGGK